MKPTKLSVIAQDMGVALASERLITSVEVDSRRVSPGGLFVALRGERVDGHDFLGEAASRGAVAALVSTTFSQEIEGLQLLRVPDPLTALQEYAKTLVARRKQLVVGITGSLGKTTTKDWTARLLSTCYRVGATRGNWNTKVTLPLTLLEMSGDEEVIVLEMGMTHAGEISRLVQIAPPDIAVLTGLSMMHIANFPSLEALGKSKGEIFLHPRTSLGILPREVPYYDQLRMMGGCPKRDFSTESSEASYALKEVEGGVEIYCEGQRVLRAPTHYLGRHNHRNLLAAISVAHAMEVPWEKMEEVIPTLQLPAMRLERVERGGIVFINDAYKSNVDTVKAALEALPTPSPGARRVAVLGEMRELGAFSHDQHVLLGEVALSHVDHLFCLGAGCSPTVGVWEAAKRSCQQFEDLASLEGALRAFLQPGDVVLVKGSRLAAMERLVDSW